MTTTSDPTARPEDAKTEYPHIVRTPGIVGGRPRVAGSRIPVWQIAGRWQSGETIDDILTVYPHLSAAAVHSALAYYWDNKGEVDAEIEEHKPENVVAWLRDQVDLATGPPAALRGRNAKGRAGAP